MASQDSSLARFHRSWVGRGIGALIPFMLLHMTFLFVTDFQGQGLPLFGRKYHLWEYDIAWSWKGIAIGVMLYFLVRIGVRGLFQLPPAIPAFLRERSTGRTLIESAKEARRQSLAWWSTLLRGGKDSGDAAWDNITRMLPFFKHPPLAFVMAFLCLTSYVEEVIFRLPLLHIGISLTSVCAIGFLFAMGHILYHPLVMILVFTEWTAVSFAVLPYGLTPCIIGHALNNIVAIYKINKRRNATAAKLEDGAT